MPKVERKEVLVYQDWFVVGIQFIYYKEVTLPQFLQNYKETKTKFQALKNIVRTETGTKSQ